jgi:ATP-dependent RNA helicase RhlB
MAPDTGRLPTRASQFFEFQQDFSLIKKWIRALTGKPETPAAAVAPAAQKPRREPRDKHTAPAPMPRGVEESKPRGHQNKPVAKHPPASRQTKAERPAWSPDQFPVPPEPGKTRFHDFDLPDPLLHAIADLGFQYCSPIQAQILPHTLAGHDAIGKAQTGTGKTAAFLITVITDLLNNPWADERYVGEPRALVIAPTRELVMQIAKDAEALTKHTDLRVGMLIGGMDYRRQQEKMNAGVVDIVVATPGRLMDFHQRGDLHLDLVQLMVIDEADRMLDMGFIPQVRRIIRATPQKSHRQTLLFSATFTDDVLRLTDQWTHDPVRIDIEPESVATQSVEQKVYFVSESEKYRVLRNVLKSDAVETAIVFANRRDQARRVEEKLRRDGIKCGLLSGEVAQNRRTATLNDFRSGKIKVLVATDVAGRGIHIDNISHVINFNLPEDPEDYVHRIGRTGRAGASGISISLVSEDDAFNMPPLEKLLGTKMNSESPPAEMLR